MTGSIITFGPMTFDFATGMLRGVGGDLRLGQRAVALLQTLITADHQPVTKSTLLEAAWPGMIVEEGNLTVQIAALRKALGHRPDGQDWIVTVPRVGYRLLAGETVQDQVESTLPMVAVLPFLNLSGDVEQEYFADGVVDDIITALSRFNSFNVVSRNSSFAYKGKTFDLRDVANELGVRYLLQGSVRRAANRLRISVQLVEGDQGQNIWAKHFDGTLDDVFDFQDRICENVVTQIEPRIQSVEIEKARLERPSSAATYDIYLRALAKISTETIANNAEAYHLLTGALENDPSSPLLLTYLSWVLEHRISNAWPPISADDVRLCGEYARAA